MEKYISEKTKELERRISDLRAQEIQFEARGKALGVTVTAALEEVGVADVIDLDKLAAQAEPMQRARIEFELIRRAIGAVRKRRVNAVEERNRSLASDMRAEAAGLRKRSEQILESARGPLAKLGELEGLKFDESIFLFQRLGPWFPIAAAYGTPRENWGPGDAIGDVGSGWGQPKHISILIEAAALERKAAVIEVSECNSADSMSAPHLDEFWIRLSEFANDRLIPTQHSIERWLAAIHGQLMKRNCLPGEPLVYTLSWKEGEIDWENSLIRLAAVGSTVTGGDGVDLTVAGPWRDGGREWVSWPDHQEHGWMR